MILVTGGTGFVGQHLIRQLSRFGYDIRLLLRPSTHSPALPLGVPVEAAVCSLRDERGLMAAMQGVDVVFHLASADRAGSRGDLNGVDVEGTASFVRVCQQAGINRLFYISHIGADRNSAFPLFRAKGLAEMHIQQSGVPYTILRSSVLFGRGDHFSEPFTQLMRKLPFIFLLPGDGQNLLQPLWVEDLISSLMLSMDEPATINQLMTVGGMETMSLGEAMGAFMDASGVHRTLVPLPLTTMHTLSMWIDQSYPRFPISIHWIDYVSSDRICPLDSLPRLFGLMPARMKPLLSYLRT